MELREGLFGRDFFVWLGTWFVHESKKETHGSTMTHVTNDVFGGHCVEVPQHEEQHLIATFLDHATARIDTLVAKTERLIELLDCAPDQRALPALARSVNENDPVVLERFDEPARRHLTPQGRNVAWDVAGLADSAAFRIEPERWADGRGIAEIVTRLSVTSVGRRQ